MQIIMPMGQLPDHLSGQLIQPPSNELELFLLLMGVIVFVIILLEEGSGPDGD